MTKAVAYIWPKMAEAAQYEEELKLISAGYRNKAEIVVGGYRLYQVT